MSVDSAVRNVARRVMAKVGTSATIRRITTGVYNPATGTVSPAAQVETDCAGRFDNYVTRELSGTVLATDRKFTIAAADVDFTPEPKDQVIVEELVYDVVSVQSEMAQHEPALFVLQLRR